MKFKSDLNFVKKCQNVIHFYVCCLMVLSVPKIVAPVTGEWMSKVQWGMILAGEIKVFRENPVRVALCPHNSHIDCSGAERGPPH